jgi:DNA polymerase-1
VSETVARMRQDGDVAPVLLAIDGNSLVHRAYHAQARTGHETWAVRGLLAQLVAAVERVDPTAIVVGFDDPGRSRRREAWPQYKARRSDKLDTLVEQLTCAADVLRGLGIAVVVPPGLEADDVLASAAAFAAGAGARTVVMTSDRDAFSLIDDTTSVLRIIDGGVEASPMLTPARLATMIGVRPDQYRDYAALRGDTSDNLAGVRGIGPKTAATLLRELGSARAAFDDLATGGERVAAAIGRSGARRLAAAGAREAWELNCEVMAMHRDLPLGIDLAGGVGCLPLPVEAVRAAFSAQQLTWTVGAAVRVLCDGQMRETGWPDEPVPDWSAGRPRFARLPPPKAHQPALF